MPSAKLRSTNLPFLCLSCDSFGDRTPTSRTPSERSNLYAMRGRCVVKQNNKVHDQNFVSYLWQYFQDTRWCSNSRIWHDFGPGANVALLNDVHILSITWGRNWALFPSGGADLKIQVNFPNCNTFGTNNLMLYMHSLYTPRDSAEVSQCPLLLFQMLHIYYMY